MIKDFKLSIGTLGALVSELTKALSDPKVIYRVSVKVWREKRSVSQNSMYWKWLTEIDRACPVTSTTLNMTGPELWHEVFKKYYCPVTDVYSNAGDASVEFRSTAALDVGEMTFYLSRIEGFCMERGIALTIPESSEYFKLMEMQVN